MPVPAISPSRAQDFQQCPLLYRFRVVDKLAEPPSAAAAKGTLVHKVLERLYDLPAGERTPTMALTLLPDAETAVAAKTPALPTLFATETERRAWRDEAAQLVRAYFALEDPTRLAPEARELFIQTDLGGLTLRGFVDRLDVAPGTGALRVVDYKTGKAPRPQYQGKALFQLKCYALALWRDRGLVPAMLQLVYLGSRELVRHEPSAAELEATEAKVVALWAAIERTARSGSWPASPGPLCPWCAHQALCPAFGGTAPELPADALERLGLANSPD
ncbi:MAG: PD-(D/E)XK nuclease family protein [Bifidobacteriaceae bacterium]|jgi:putative RecB family exonuclease|nr:PD-(D/E)XK nuclease family protein [Bifidobacteriaceae bacterium]